MQPPRSQPVVPPALPPAVLPLDPSAVPGVEPPAVLPVAPPSPAPPAPPAPAGPAGPPHREPVPAPSVAPAPASPSPEAPSPEAPSPEAPSAEAPSAEAPTAESLSQAIEAIGAGAAAVAQQTQQTQQTQPDAPSAPETPVDTAPMLGLDAAVLPPARAGVAGSHLPHVSLVPAQRELGQPWVDEETQSVVSARSTPLVNVIASGSDLDVIAVGDYDDRLRAQARDLQALRHPVLLAPFVGLGEAAGDPQTLTAAWRHTREVLRAEHADQVQMVWCPSPDTFQSGAADRYYPGDDQVDWVCTTVVGVAGQGFSEVAAPLLAWSAGHAVPLMVRLVPPQQDPAAWLRAAAADLRTQPEIRALVYAGGAADADELSALESLPGPGSVSVGRAPGGQSATSITLPAAVAAIAAGASAVADLGR